MVLWSDPLYLGLTCQSITGVVKFLLNVASMELVAHMVRRGAAKVGSEPVFSTRSEREVIICSRSSPLLFVSGPNRVEWALVSVPISSS